MWIRHYDTAIDRYVEETVRADAFDLETRIVMFLFRTKLPVEQCTLVKFKGRTFIQWKYAVGSPVPKIPK